MMRVHINHKLTMTVRSNLMQHEDTKPGQSTRADCVQNQVVDNRIRSIRYILQSGWGQQLKDMILGMPDRPNEEWLFDSSIDKLMAIKQSANAVKPVNISS